MKKKLIYIILGIILVATLVSATIVFNLTDARFTPQPSGAVNLNKGNVTFDCDKIPMVVYVSSGDKKISDDFEQAVRGVCIGEVTNAIDWNNRHYKQNEYGLRSFDDDILKEDVCGKNQQNYNITSKECYEDVMVVGSSETSSPMYECADGDIETCPGGLSSGLGTRCYFTILKMATGWNDCAEGWVLQ